METKKDYIDFIENNALVKAAVRSVDKEQGERILAITRGVAEQIADVFVPVIQRIKSDPEYAKQLRKQLQKKSQKLDIENSKKES